MDVFAYKIHIVLVCSSRERFQLRTPEEAKVLGHSSTSSISGVASYARSWSASYGRCWSRWIAVARPLCTIALLPTMFKSLRHFLAGLFLCLCLCHLCLCLCLPLPARLPLLCAARIPYTLPLRDQPAVLPTLAYMLPDSCVCCLIHVSAA